MGLLVAIGLARFADFQSEARTAAFDGVEGGFQAAVQVVHAKWLADGAQATTVVLEGGSLVVSPDG